MLGLLPLKNVRQKFLQRWKNSNAHCNSNAGSAEKVSSAVVDNCPFVIVMPAVQAGVVLFAVQPGK